MAGKNNVNESAIDKSSFFFVSLCGICHPGGGPGEFDRDGYPYYDAATGQFGYELSGAPPAFDGDYAVLNQTGDALNPAPWDVTGVSGPDCMYCHRSERTVNGPMNMNWIWRAATLRGGANLVDDQGASVPAFAAASTAGQGWFSNIELAEVPPGMPPLATSLQIDYAVGLADGSLTEEDDGGLHMVPRSVGDGPKDYACWGCHATAERKKRGQTWFDPEWDVHYRGHNKLGDEDPDNDVAAGESRTCNICHPGDSDHRIAKGNAFSSSVHDETDYVGFRSCRDCHLSEINGVPNPDKDPDAPEPEFWIHTDELTIPMMEALSCQACHIPYAAAHADMVVDHAVTGVTVGYTTADFLSADPQEPSDPDRSRWYPAFKHKIDSDGVERLFPVKILNSAWWADWDRNGTPEDLSDDVIAPVPLWKVRQITGGAPLPGVTDDNGDGKPEVNRLAEIDAYIQALKGNDSYGRQVAANPVLVKGDHVWYEDPAAPENVSSFEYHDTGVAVEGLHPFSMDHNVLPRGKSWGVDEFGSAVCYSCHRWANGGQSTDVIDRLVLVDPFGPDGQPVYKTVRELTGVDPP